MNTKQKQLNMLGLALRAGQLIHGDESVEKAIKRSKVHCVILASDVSESTNERYERIAYDYHVPLFKHMTRIEISHAIGKTRSICAISNKGMANKFISYETGDNTMTE